MGMRNDLHGHGNGIASNMLTVTLLTVTWVFRTPFVRDFGSSPIPVLKRDERWIRHSQSTMSERADKPGLLSHCPGLPLGFRIRLLVYSAECKTVRINGMPVCLITEENPRASLPKVQK